MRNQGFTLVETLIAVVIIIILAAIAYPSYTKHIVGVNRADLKVELIQLSAKLSTYQQVNRNLNNVTLLNDGNITPASGTLSTLRGTTTFPRQGTPLYNINLDVLTATSYTLTATPIARRRQDGDGVVCLDNLGQKFWQRGVGVCTLSPTSTWDN